LRAEQEQLQRDYRSAIHSRDEALSENANLQTKNQRQRSIIDTLNDQLERLALERTLSSLSSATQTHAVIFTVCIDAFLRYSLRYKSLEQSLHIEKERLRSCLEAAQEEKAKLMKVRKGAE